MNTAEIIPIRNEEPIRSEVDRLLDERRNVLAELARLDVLNEPVREAEAALGAVDRAIAALDAEERAEMETWARSGDGSPPAPRNVERANLVRLPHRFRI